MNKSVFTCEQSKAKRASSATYKFTLSPSLDEDPQLRIQRPLFKAFLLCVSKAPVCEVLEWINLPLLNLIKLF